MHSLAVKNDGTVWAWGDNNYGQLGNGTTTNSNLPVQVSGLTGVVQVAGGDYHSLAVQGGAATCTASACSPQTVLSGQTATLHGSASSCTYGPPTSYLWSIVSKPSGSYANINNYTSATASLTPDVVGVYTVSLVVSNGSATSAPAYTKVTANACSQGFWVYPTHATAESNETVHFNAQGGSNDFTWSLSQNQSGAAITPNGSTCLYTAGASQGTDILQVTDTACGTFLYIPVTVQPLPPQVTEARFCPPATNGATSVTLYATFSGPVTGAQYEYPPGIWNGMAGSGTSWQATITVPNPSVARSQTYAVRGTVSGGAGVTAQRAVTLWICPKIPILLVHGWANCVNDCAHFGTSSDINDPSYCYLRVRLAAEGYDARVVTGIDGWGDLFDNAIALRTYIDAQGLQGEPVVLAGYSYGGLIIRAFLYAFPTYAVNVKAAITVDTPHNGTPLAGMLHAHDATLGAMLRRIFGGDDRGRDHAIQYLETQVTNENLRDSPMVPFYEVGSYRAEYAKGALDRQLDPIFLFGPHDGVVGIDSQCGYGLGGNHAFSQFYESQHSFEWWSFNGILHAQIMDGGPDFQDFYTKAFQPVIHEILPPTTASCTPGFAAQTLKTQVPEAAVIPSATQPRVVVNQSGTATVGVEATVAVTVESTLQATFAISLSGGTASVWLTTPSSAVINPASANGDSIKYDYASDTGMETHVYTLRAPAAGLWTVHILPSATDPYGLSYTMTAQNLSTLGMTVSVTPTDVLPGDPLTLSATLGKATVPAMGATVDATITLPDNTAQAVTLYDDGAHGDGAADDGVYANSYSGTAQSGGYSVAVNASGTDATLGAWQRAANANFNVGRVAGAFTSVYAESAPDADANGKYESLDITAGLMSLNPGTTGPLAT